MLELFCEAASVGHIEIVLEAMDVRLFLFLYLENVEIIVFEKQTNNASDTRSHNHCGVE